MAAILTDIKLIGGVLGEYSTEDLSETVIGAPYGSISSVTFQL